MRLTKIKEVNDFLEIVNHCKGEVTLTSQYGDKYNLKIFADSVCCNCCSVGRAW